MMTLFFRTVTQRARRWHRGRRDALGGPCLNAFGANGAMRTDLGVILGSLKLCESSVFSVSFSE